MNGIVVVAHPDDEALWFAGLVMSRPEIRWTVVCCTIPRRDPERAWMFFEAAARMGAAARLLPFTEPDPSRDDLRGLDLLDITGCDIVVTHNERGEYGHLHHRTLHRWLRSRIRKGQTLITPGYGMEPGPLVVNVEPAAKLTILKAYRHTTTYRGHRGPKWQNLVRHYHDDVGFDLWTETYYEHVG